MPVLPTQLRAHSRPLAHPDNVVAGDRWRVTVLAENLLRLEWSPTGTFCDLPSQAVLFRDLPPAEFTVRDEPGGLEIATPRFRLTYDRGPFTPHGLSVLAIGVSNYRSTWRFGEQGQGNLGGTARTLDGVDGRCPLEDGVLSQDGIACYDDSGTVLLTEDGWVQAREPGSLDLYVFVAGRDYLAGLDSLFRVTGPQPQLPRWALGNWWSRYHRYTERDYLELMDRFAAERLPFSVAVIDMDWHPTRIAPTDGSGWTGFSWDRELFPDPPGFLAALHERGLRTTLNLHPADGVGTHEDCYSAVARVVGRTDGTPVPFDVTDPGFWSAYFEQVLHPREAEGVDFWWVDWQSGRVSGISGLDPLWMLNHLHFLDAARPGGPTATRPLTFSRYAGLGSHRYPVGFSGDTVVSWASLAFQPEFTATAANVGYGWWSHDIGGHMFGGKDDELATRWVQLGVFSPVLRLHSTNDPFNSKEPWRFGPRARDLMARYLRLRHQLLPYLGTMARRTHTEGRSLVEPMYYTHAWQEDAYRVPRQFMFGSSLLVAPVTTPVDPVSRMATTPVWLPSGVWVDLMTGTVYDGGRTVPLCRDLTRLPVLARPGTVLPLVPQEAVCNDTGPSPAVEVWVVAGADGRFDLVEDRDDDRWATTTLAVSTGPDSAELTISAVTGSPESVPSQRDWSLVLVGAGRVDSVEAGSQVLPLERGPVPNSVRVRLGAHPTGTGLRVQVRGDLTLADLPVADRVFDVLDAAQADFRMKRRVYEAVRDHPPATAMLAVEGVAAQDPTLTPALRTAVAELLLARR